MDKWIITEKLKDGLFIQQNISTNEYRVINSLGEDIIKNRRDAMSTTSKNNLLRSKYIERDIKIVNITSGPFSNLLYKIETQKNEETFYKCAIVKPIEIIKPVPHNKPVKYFTGRVIIKSEVPSEFEDIDYSQSNADSLPIIIKSTDSADDWKVVIDFDTDKYVFDTDNQFKIIIGECGELLIAGEYYKKEEMIDKNNEISSELE